MELPTWLNYAQSKEDLEDIDLVPPPSIIETLPALALAFKCAKESILSPTGISALNQTFPQEEVLHAAIEQEMKGIQVYVIRWVEATRREYKYNREPFHIVPEVLSNESVVVGNIFIDLPDVHYFLPKGEAIHWTKAERCRVVLLSWFILHAAVEALVSILYQKQIVAPSQPTQLAFWDDHLRFLGGFHGMKLFGSRSWILEEQLGGKLCLFEAEDRLVISQPGKRRCYPFTDEMIEMFLSSDQAVYRGLYPLKHFGPGEWFSRLSESLTKNRAAYRPAGLPRSFFIKY